MTNLSLKNRLAKHVQKLPKSGIRDFFELINQMDDVISLGIGEPDFVTPQNIRQAAIDSLNNGNTSYTSNLGMLSLREAVCKYVETHYGVSYCPVEESIITVGVSEALDLAMRAILNPGDEAIYCEPCFVSYEPEIRMAFGEPVKVECLEKDNFALDPEKLRAKIGAKTKLLLLNFPCNPTGATLNIKQMTEIAKIAVEHDLFVITDEIYSELTYENSLPTIASLPGMKERTLFLHGFSKAYAMTGFRAGYACGPADIIDAMMKIHQYAMMCAPTIAQVAAEEALKNSWDEMLEMKAEYRQRRDFIVDSLNAMGLKCFRPEGAFYVFPNITSTGLNSMEFASQLLKEYNVAVIPGTAFGQCGEGFIRCSYATSMDKISQAMTKMAQFVTNLTK
jgi:aminotransferase